MLFCASTRLKNMQLASENNFFTCIKTTDSTVDWQLCQNIMLGKVPPKNNLIVVALVVDVKNVCLFVVVCWNRFSIQNAIEWRSVKMELELEGTTSSEGVSVEGVTPTTPLLWLRVQGVLAVVKLLSHFWKKRDGIINFTSFSSFLY